ncbi:MAG: hypothetical protein ACOX6C_01865 [Patescibacteria group bacterium]|jgi:hypothetical protein
MPIIKLKNKKTVIIAFFGIVAFVLLAVIFVLSWLEKGNNVSSSPEETYQTRPMREDEKLRYQINPEKEVEVIKDSEGDFIYKINE